MDQQQIALFARSARTAMFVCGAAVIAAVFSASGTSAQQGTIKVPQDLCNIQPVSPSLKAKVAQRPDLADILIYLNANCPQQVLAFADDATGSIPVPEDVAIILLERGGWQVNKDGVVPASTVEPTVTPTVEPTVNPTVEPTVNPTVEPTVNPTVEPTVNPTVEPTVNPTVEPTVNPTVEPTVNPTVEPTVNPTVEPTVNPTVEPTVNPTVEPTVNPTVEPTVNPTVEPTVNPTVEPTVNPTATPTPSPSSKPNNGIGNGDQDAPGNSCTGNNAENADCTVGGGGKKGRG